MLSVLTPKKGGAEGNLEMMESQCRHTYVQTHQLVYIKYVPFSIPIVLQ